MKKSINILMLIGISAIICGLVTLIGCTVQKFGLEYKSTEGGNIQGEVTQTVKEGEDGSAVTAVADEGYKFVKWSDGVETAERQEKNVTADITVTAEFESLTKYYNLIYIVETEEGQLIGEAYQTVKEGEDGSVIKAVPNEGYKFVKWTDGVETPERQEKNVTRWKSAKAIFERIYYKIKYETNGYGSLLGEISQTVEYGGESKQITAKADAGYKFIKWSDGSKEQTRKETNVLSDKTLTAYFGLTVEYKVANGGGTIVGETMPGAAPGEKFAAVEALANPGYIFCGWSDLAMDNTRQDEAGKSLSEYVAYFEPTEKTFKYDYGENYGKPTASGITLNRKNLKNLTFAMPELSGYSFCGWYADKDYTIKVVNENGVYMLGNSVFTLKSNTLYARWQTREAAEIPVYKLLITFVDEVDAVLHSSVTDTDIQVKSKMCALEREYSYFITAKMNDLLNEWFEGIVKFEVDSYFTLSAVHTESFSRRYTVNDKIDYTLYTKDMPELSNLNGLYHSTLASFNMNDYEYLLRSGSGSGSAKYGCINMENYFMNPTEKLCHKYLSMVKSGQRRLSLTTVLTFMHKFVYACEQTFYGGLTSFYQVIENKQGSLDICKWYLLGKADYNGEKVGIPREYWLHKLDVIVAYACLPVNSNTAGYTVMIDNGNEIRFARGKISYGSSLTIKAVPLEGYRFVKWSDGVVSETRHDSNIISYLEIKVIFEKITN